MKPPVGTRTGAFACRERTGELVPVGGTHERSRKAASAVEIGLTGLARLSPRKALGADFLRAGGSQRIGHDATQRHEIGFAR
jgi:hypothetical protein